MVFKAVKRQQKDLIQQQETLIQAQEQQLIKQQQTITFQQKIANSKTTVHLSGISTVRIIFF